MKKLFGIILGTVIGALGVDSASANEKVSFLMDFRPSGNHAPFYFARSQGWYKEAGIDLSIEVGKGSTFSVQSVGAGTVDFALADFGTAYVGIGKGAEIVSVMSMFGNTPLTFYWLKTSGINGPKDFPGRSIGNPPGDAVRAMWPAFAKAAGIDEKTVKWVSVAGAAKFAALRSGAVDIISDFFSSHDLKVREFGDNLGFVNWADVGLNLYGLSVITNKKTVETRPELVRKVLSVTQRANIACMKDFDPCLKAMTSELSGLDPQVIREEWSRVTQLMRTPESENIALGWANPERIVANYNTISAYMEIEKPFDPNSGFSNDFLDKEFKYPK